MPASPSARICSRWWSLVNILCFSIVYHKQKISREFQAPRTSHLKEGLHQLLCLVPYEVVNVEIWEHIIPRWLEAIVKDVPQREVHHLKLLLSKILDPVLSPLGFDAKKMYRFLSVRFKKTTAKVQEQALTWLQVSFI